MIKNKRSKRIKINDDVSIPPITTVGSFMHLPKYNIKSSENKDVLLSSSSGLDLPETWDWKNTHETDTLDIKNKKKNISISGDQESCGSCWAISTAGMINDLFVVSGKSTSNPDLSTTYILSCYPQKQCDGGQPSIALEQISKTGIKTNECVDYSWCTDDPECSGRDNKVVNSSGHTGRMNSLIPSCGCTIKETYTTYKITQPYLHYYSTKSPSLVGFRENIKHSIKNHGPALGGFAVFNNFIKGDYSKTEGVYLEDIDYDGDKYFIQKDLRRMVGGHAVCIIGWGVTEKEYRYKDAFGQVLTARIPYWYCRNSWTRKWGDDGHFKMAMYPYNKVAQFDKIVKTRSGLIGGMVLSTADKIIRSKKFKDENNNILEEENTDENGEPVTENGEKISESNGKLKVLFFVFFLIAVSGLALLIKIYLKRRKNKIPQLKSIKSVDTKPIDVDTLLTKEPTTPAKPIDIDEILNKYKTPTTLPTTTTTLPTTTTTLPTTTTTLPTTTTTLPTTTTTLPTTTTTLPTTTTTLPTTTTTLPTTTTTLPTTTTTLPTTTTTLPTTTTIPTTTTTLPTTTTTTVSRKTTNKFLDRIKKDANRFSV